jgi:hypothetical protein
VDYNYRDTIREFGFSDSSHGRVSVNVTPRLGYRRGWFAYMARVVDARLRRKNPSIFRHFIVGLAYVLVTVLTLIGLAAIGFIVYTLRTGTGWKPEDLNALLMYDSPAMHTARAVWEDIKYLIQYGAYLIAAIAFFIAVAQVKTISKLISDFLVARGPIYELAGIFTKAEASMTKLAGEVDRLSKFEQIVQLTAERLEEALQQIGDLQRLQVSERTEDTPALPAPPAAVNGQAVTVTSAEDDQKNWESLRELWNANGRRLDDVIERIANKRQRTRFARMPRTNYPAIINGLADERLISETARGASLKLHSTFMSYRPRNRKISDQVVADLMVLGAMLEKELSSPVPDFNVLAQTIMPVDNAAVPAA